MNNLISKLKPATPTILTFVGVVGVVATTILAVRATPKAVDIIKKDSRINHDGDPYGYTKLEAVKSCWKCYIPATVIGISTMACIMGAGALNKRSQASLTSAYAMLDQSYKQYRKAATSVFGKDADAKIAVQAAKENWTVTADGHNMDAISNDGSEQLLFYDIRSDRYFTSTLASVINAEYHFNRNLALRGDGYLNEFYTFLGIELTEEGHSIGWSWDQFCDEGFMWLDFENRYTKLDDGMECYIIHALCEPIVLDID